MKNSHGRIRFVLLYLIFNSAALFPANINEKSSQIDSLKYLENKIEQLKVEIRQLKQQQAAENDKTLKEAIDVAITDKYIAQTNNLIDQSASLLSYVQYSLWFVTFVMALIGLPLGIVSFLGYRRYKDFKKRLQKLTNKTADDAHDTISKIQQDSTAAIQSVNERLNRFQNEKEKESQLFLNRVHIFNEGVNMYHSGKLDACISILEEIAPNDYVASCYLADALSSKGEYDKAIETANSAIRLAEKPERAYSILGEAFRRMGDYNRSIENCLKANTFAQGDYRKSSSFNGLGFSYYLNEDYEKAINAFNDSLAYKVNCHTALCGLAKVYTKQGRWGEAETNYKKAINCAREVIKVVINEDEPIHVSAYFALAFSYFALNKIEPSRYKKTECLSHLKKALGITRNQGIIKTQIKEFENMKCEDVVSQDLLHECLELLEKNVIKI